MELHTGFIDLASVPRPHKYSISTLPFLFSNHLEPCRNQSPRLCRFVRRTADDQNPKTSSSDCMAYTPTDRLPLAYHGRCDKHEETAAFFRCNGTRNDGTPCPIRPRPESNFNYLPTCGRHKNQVIEAARCEAIETCGKACYRLSAADPPFNLCLKHCGGTSTLPSYLMKLPAEIRMMIFEYVFPATIPARRYHESISWRSYGLNLAILKMNKKICHEGLDVLYGKTEFGVVITHDEITMMGKTWKRPGVGGSIPSWTQVHPPRVVQRIKKVNLQVFLGRGTSLPPHGPGESSSWMNQIAGVGSMIDSILKRRLTRHFNAD